MDMFTKEFVSQVRSVIIELTSDPNKIVTRDTVVDSLGLSKKATASISLMFELNLLPEFEMKPGRYCGIVPVGGKRPKKDAVEKGSYKCSICGQYGHNSRKCPEHNKSSDIRELVMNDFGSDSKIAI